MAQRTHIRLAVPFLLAVVLAIAGGMGSEPDRAGRVLQTSHGTVSVRRVVVDSEVKERVSITRGNETKSVDLVHPFDGGVLQADGRLWAYGYEHGADGNADRLAHTNRLFVWSITESMEFRLIATIERNGRTATGGTPPPLVEAIVVHEERDELHLHCWTGPDDGTREWIRFRMSSGERLAPIVPAQAQRLVGVHAVLEVDALAVPNTGDTLVEWCIIRTVKRDRVVFEHDQSLLLLDSEGREKARWEFSNRWGDDRRRKLGVRTDWELADALRGSLTSKPDGCYLKDEKGELRLLVRIEKGADGKSTSLPVVEEQSPPPK